MFKKGFSVAREQEEKNKLAQENAGKRIFDFFISKDGGEADVIFLTEEPINFNQHIVRENGTFRTYTCTGDDNCSLCNSGNEAKYKGAFLVWDKEPFSYKNREGKEINNDMGALRVYARGIKDITQLDRISTKYGLAGRMMTIIRNGSGQNTSYTFERGEKVEVTEDEIMALLPDKIKDEYNGTMESLYDILEEQLKIRIKDFVESEDDEEYEDNDVIMGVEEEKPVKKKLNRKKAMFKK